MNLKSQLVALSAVVAFVLGAVAYLDNVDHEDASSRRPGPQTEMMSPAPALIVVGDSLAFGAGWYIDHDLTSSGSLPPNQTAVIGFTTSQLVDAADRTVAASPRGGQFVFASGTNDVGHAATDGPSINVGLGQLDAVLGRAQTHGKCVVTVGVTSHGTSQRAALATEWNRRSSELAARHGGQFVDWDHLSLPHPEWFIDDGIHHTPAGQQAYADAIVAATHACS